MLLTAAPAPLTNKTVTALCAMRASHHARLPAMSAITPATLPPKRSERAPTPQEPLWLHMPPPNLARELPRTPPPSPNRCVGVLPCLAPCACAPLPDLAANRPFACSRRGFGPQATRFCPRTFTKRPPGLLSWPRASRDHLSSGRPPPPTRLMRLCGVLPQAAQSGPLIRAATIFTRDAAVALRVFC